MVVVVMIGYALNHVGNEWDLDKKKMLDGFRYVSLVFCMHLDKCIK